MKGIIEKRYDDLYIRAAGGARLAEMQAELERDGYYLPINSPWVESTVGGAIAANFSSPERQAYGEIRELLLAAEVVLGDGRRLRLGRPLVKDVAGYAVHKLLIGSYGSLGLITEASLRVFPRPAGKVSLLLPCRTAVEAWQMSKSLAAHAEKEESLFILKNTRVDGRGSFPADDGLLVSVEGPAAGVREALSRWHRSLSTSQWTEGILQEGMNASDVWTSSLRGSSWMIRMGIPPRLLPHGLDLCENTMADCRVLADASHGLLYIVGRQAWNPEMEQQERRLRDFAVAAGGYALLIGKDIFPPRGFIARENLQPILHRLMNYWDPAGILDNGLPLY